MLFAAMKNPTKLVSPFERLTFEKLVFIGKEIVHLQPADESAGCFL